MANFPLSLIVFIQEIIEFPVLKVNSSSFEIDSIFHNFVEPTVNKELTTFCTEVRKIPH